VRRDVFVLVSVAAVLLGTAFRSSSPPVGPGDKIGEMILVRGVEPKADEELWRSSCDPVIPKPGLYRRTCRVVPLVHRLFIGYGDRERTRQALNSAWKQLKWDLWFDGRHVNLPRFGTSERTLYSPAAGGKNAILREWSVTLIGATPGEHTIRYRSQSHSLGTTDATWTFPVR